MGRLLPAAGFDSESDADSARRGRAAINPMRGWNGITLRITLLGWMVTLVTLALFIVVIVPEQ